MIVKKNNHSIYRFKLSKFVENLLTSKFKRNIIEYIVDDISFFVLKSNFIHFNVHSKKKNQNEDVLILFEQSLNKKIISTSKSLDHSRATFSKSDFEIQEKLSCDFNIITADSYKRLPVKARYFIDVKCSLDQGTLPRKPRGRTVKIDRILDKANLLGYCPNNILTSSLGVEMASNLDEDKDDLAFKSLLLDYLIEDGYDETVSAFDKNPEVVAFLSNYASIIDKEILIQERKKIDTKLFSLV